MEEITFKDFEEKYMHPVTRWDFTKFAIVCKKCGGSKVEYANTIAVGSGYYEYDIDRDGLLVVKMPRLRKCVRDRRSHDD